MVRGGPAEQDGEFRSLRLKVSGARPVFSCAHCSRSVLSGAKSSRASSPREQLSYSIVTAARGGDDEQSRDPEEVVERSIASRT